VEQLDGCRDDRPRGRRAKRLNGLRKQIEARGGIVGLAPGCPPELEEEFLEQVLACELEEEGPPLIEHLRAAGVEVARADELDEPALTSKLWEVIEALGRLRVYLGSTDHLSDRDLYRYLCEEMLEQPTRVSDQANSAWYFDVIGSGSEEDVAIYLRYYADPEERRHWASHFPDTPIPEPEKRPFDRDRYLPRAPWGRPLSSTE
jgi:hypothetical protein